MRRHPHARKRFARSALLVLLIWLVGPLGVEPALSAQLADGCVATCPCAAKTDGHHGHGTFAGADAEAHGHGAPHDDSQPHIHEAGDPDDGCVAAAGRAGCTDDRDEPGCPDDCPSCACGSQVQGALHASTLAMVRVPPLTLSPAEPAPGSGDGVTRRLPKPPRALGVAA